MTDEQITTTANSGLAKGGVSCFVETFVVNQTFVLRMNFCGKNPALRQALNVVPHCRKADRTNSTFGFLPTHKANAEKPKELFFTNA